MKRVLIAAVVCAGAAAVLGQAGPAAAQTTHYVDAAGLCGGSMPCYAHPQDAVNAASAGDTVRVYPGTYGSRFSQCPWPPNCSCSDLWAPALIVYKDGLTIESVEGPASTTIEATHTCWSNAGPVERSTANGLTGIGGWAPSASVVVAENVTIRGFTFHRPFNCGVTNDCFWNTAGVFIGSKGAGYNDFLGHANGATVEQNVFSNVWHAVYIWHSSDNTIADNTIAALGNTGHWAAISSYDGWDNTSTQLQPQSTGTTVSGNTIADKGISLGAWAPSVWTSIAGSSVCCNATTQVGVAYAGGPAIVGCNTGSFWQSNTDAILRITGVAVSVNSPVVALGAPVTLNAQLTYDGSADGSGVEVAFLVGSHSYTANTLAGGTASVVVSDLPAGVHEVKAKTVVCPDCSFTSEGSFLAIYDPTGGFVTGGGWIWSPAGALTRDTSLEGKATFGFVAKYKKGASLPDGTAEFQFQVGGLNFHSTAYDWLVVAGSKAQFKGSGTVNGEAGYGFMIFADDDSPDTFRIRIVAADGSVVYDNGSQLALGGGSIVIHK